MNRNQREDLAKVFYDFAKITFAALIIGNLAAKDKFDQSVFMVGMLGTFTSVIVGLYLRKGAKKK